MPIIEQYKNIIKDTFKRNNCRAGDIIPMRTFRFGVMQSLNGVQRGEFIDTIEELINQRLLSYENNGAGLDVLRLTEDGYNALYCDPDEVSIAKKIMKVFSDQHLDVGQVVTFRFIRMSFLPTLNPKEQDAFVDVCNKLIMAHWINYQHNNNGLECLMLLDSGADYLYKGHGNIEHVING